MEMEGVYCRLSAGWEGAPTLAPAPIQGPSNQTALLVGLALEPRHLADCSTRPNVY